MKSKNDSNHIVDGYLNPNRIIAENNNREFRTDDEPWRELVESVRAIGIVEPILVSYIENGKYRLIAGFRRLAVANALRLDRVPIRLFPKLNDEQIVEIRLAENLHRLNMNPIEEGRAYDILRKQDYTVEQIATKVGKSTAHVGFRMRFLDLPDRAQQLIESGHLPIANAITMLPYIKKSNENYLSRAAEMGCRVGTQHFAGLLASGLTEIHTVRNNTIGTAFGNLKYLPSGEWSLHILAILNIKEEGFENVRRKLHPISARVFSMKLQDMRKLELINRRVTNDSPPRSSYSITDEGKRILNIFAQANNYIGNSNIECTDSHPNNHPCHLGMKVNGDIEPHRVNRAEFKPE
jgi:ParB/RepB/Spo0J family partition protein